jgi:hypothetical protein
MPRRIILLENGLSSASTPNGAKSIGLLSGSLFLKDSNNVTTPVSGSGSSTNTISPSDYGAIGDGIADDTVALQEAFSQARSQGLPIILNDTYNVSSTIDVVDTIVICNTNSKIISDTNGYLLSAAGSRTSRYSTISTEYNPNGDVLRGHSTISITSSVIQSLNIQNGDLIKVTSARKFNINSGENVLQGEIQRVLSADSISGVIQIYGFWEDTYLASDNVQLSKVNFGKFETLGTLHIEQGGQTSSKGILLKYLDTPKVDVKVINAIDRSIGVVDCYSPFIHADNYGANQDGLGYGIAIGNCTMYGTFMGTCESNRHSITTGGDSDRGVSWGNKVTNFTGKAYSQASIFDTHSSCGSIYYDNCIAIGGFNRNGATISSGFPNGFSIEGRTTHIVNCTVKDCYAGASSGDYNNIQEIYIKGLNCDDCTVGFSAVGTQVERLTIEDIDLWNQELDPNGVCVNLSGLSTSFLNIKNIKSYNSRCGINLGSNDLSVDQSGYVIENLVCYYADRWTYSVPSNFYSAIRLYDSNNPIKIINCETNAPRMITSNPGLTCSSLSIQNCRSFGVYDNHINLQFPVDDLSIKDCIFTDTSVTGYPVFASAGANIKNLNFTGNTLNGTTNLRNIYVNPSNTFTNIFDSGNTLNISIQKESVSSNGAQPYYWVVEGNILNPSKIIGKLGASGTPEGTYAAGVGTIFINKTGSASTTLFLKESGSGNTGWVAK